MSDKYIKIAGLSALILFAYALGSYFKEQVSYRTTLIVLHYWRRHQTSTTVSLKSRLSQIMQSESDFSCEVVLIHSLFHHGFINKPNSKK